MEQKKINYDADKAFGRIALLLKRFDEVDTSDKLLACLQSLAMEFCYGQQCENQNQKPCPPQLDSLPSVIAAINKEIAYQDKKWGKEHNRNQTVEGHLLIMRKELQEAEEGWMKNSSGRNSVEMELVQVVAVGVQALNNIVTSGKTLY